MANQFTANIPFNRIIKVGLFINSKKQTLTTIYNNLKKEYPQKEVYIANCGFFGMSNFIPCFGLKADNILYSNDWSNGWMGLTENTIEFNAANTRPLAYKAAISGYPVLLENGKKSAAFSYCVDNSNRGRTMLGYTKDSIILSVIADVSGNSDFTLDEELNYMKALKCQYAINLDGGGSAQCNFNGQTISSSRKVHNFFYMIAEPDMSTPERIIQSWLNEKYNAGLTVDGSLGPASKKAIIKAMQIECKVAADGSWGPASKKAYKYIGQNSKNNTENKIKIIEAALCRKGYWDSPLTDTFTTELKQQVIKFQKASKLSQDGMVGNDTIAALFK